MIDNVTSINNLINCFVFFVSDLTSGTTVLGKLNELNSHHARLSSIWTEVQACRLELLWFIERLHHSNGVHGAGREGWPTEINTVYLILQLYKTRYGAVSLWHGDFSPYYKIFPTVGPWGQGMWCLLWVQMMIYVLRQSLHWCILYHVMLCRVIMQPNLYKMLYCKFSCFMIGCGNTSYDFFV